MAEQIELFETSAASAPGILLVLGIRYIRTSLWYIFCATVAVGSATAVTIVLYFE